MSPRKKTTLPGNMLPPKSGVRIRMYNTGFGDCFLLAFPAGQGGVFYMLIDCGVHHRFEDGDLQIQKVARDIAAATGSHLDLVVITHEHTDHTWGFKHAQEIFNQIEIDNLWLAWTEDPDDKLAQLLKQLYGQQMAGLTAAIQKLNQADKAFALELQSLFEFEPAAVVQPLSGGRLDEMEFLRQKSLKKLIRSKDYRQPGEAPLSLPGVMGVKVFVLGPPKDKDLIKILDKASELYLTSLAVDETSSFAVAAQAADHQEDDQSWVARHCPFDVSNGILASEAASHSEFKDFYKQFYGFSAEPGQGAAWRRIDYDWLMSAEQLALSINSRTNNTSLVLAIELNAEQVLLFAADAQVGNWLSWQKQEWPGQGAAGQTLTGADLLKRTVFYKVGHHGSRNATLSHKGLEMMTDPDLVAMIPVNEKWARDVMDWEHPSPAVLAPLLEKTRGRVIRMDEIPTGDAPPARPENTSPELWQEFTNRLNWDHSPEHLWVEYTFETDQT